MISFGCSWILWVLFLHALLAGAHDTSSRRSRGKHAQKRATTAPTSTTSITLLSTENATSTIFALSLSFSETPSLSASIHSPSSPTTPNQNPQPSTTLQSVPIPSPTETSSDLQNVLDRRLPFIISSVGSLGSIPQWIESLSALGQWPDVDYTTGCDAQRANWPAQNHWSRINTLAAAYHGASDFNAKTKAYERDPNVLAAISKAMDWWFSNDYQNIACLDNGGTSSCPCGTPGMWNTNWFSNLIGTPTLVGQACLLLLQGPQGSLTPSQYSNCTVFTSRSFATFNYTVIGGVGTLTGANTLDVASIGVAAGLLLGSEDIVAQAYNRVHNEVIVQNATRADGIRPDGSFSQHKGILYDGNYGKDYSNDVLALEIQAANTPWEAGTSSRSAFTGYVDGFQWAIYRNIITGVLHWDFSSLGRFISFPVADNQATGSIKINLTEIEVLGQQWGEQDLSHAATQLQKNTTSANAGKLNGNRVFWNNDYMVQRGDGYVTTLKMYSNRTTNTECTNSQNPLGFHLADGTVYTYLNGNEYEDIAAAWDWNLIPGTTVDYGATALTCDTTTKQGIEAFVGGASDGEVGVAAMRYTNPVTKAFRFQKAWFFFKDDVQHVVVSAIASSNAAPIKNVLDQKRRSGDVYLDDKVVSNGTTTIPQPRSLWHANVGYLFEESTANAGNALTLALETKTGKWSAIGISTKPDPVVDFFTASIDQDPLQLDKRLSYSVYPAVDLAHFRRILRSTDSKYNSSKRSQNEEESKWGSPYGGPPVTVQNDASVSAVLDRAHQTAGIVFWTAQGGQARLSLFPGHIGGPVLAVDSNRALVVIIRLDHKWQVSVSDPSATLSDVTLKFTWEISTSWKDAEHGHAHIAWSGTKQMHIKLPQDEGLRGSTVNRPLF